MRGASQEHLAPLAGRVDVVDDHGLHENIETPLARDIEEVFFLDTCVPRHEIDRVHVKPRARKQLEDGLTKGDAGSGGNGKGGERRRS